MRATTALMTLCLAGTAGLAGPELHQMTDDQALADLPERWAGIAELFDVPGAAIAIVKDGQTFVWTYGKANPETGADVTPDTMFYIASITKTYTATAIVKLAEEGKLSLNDPITDYLPGITLGDGVEASSVTVEDLISHRKGINSGIVVALDAYTGEITPERYDYWLERGTVEGSTEYTNVNFTLAGRIIEAVTGMGWRDYLAEAVFGPAGLTRTTGYASEIYTDPDVAFPTVWDGHDWVIAAQQKTDRTMHAAGGLGTTARDAAAWLQLHLSDGTINGSEIVGAPAARAMRELHAELDEPNGSIRINEGFGHGWNIGTFSGQTPLASHGGGYVGTSTWFGFLPEHNAGVTVLVNGAGLAGGWGSIVGVDALERVSGITPEWSPYERFQARANELKSAGEAPRVDPGLVTAGTAHCTRPLGQYTGWFRNKHLGTLIVARAGDRLTMHVGDSPLAPEPGSEPDTFSVAELIDDVNVLRFVIAPNGSINAVEMESDELGVVTFAR